MRQERMFEPPPSMEVEAPEPTRPEEARVLRPERRQLQWVARDLEASLPLAHPARAIWSFLEQLDLAAFYGPIRAVLDRPGRPTTDPEVLLGVWLLATVEGVSSGWRSCAKSTMPTAGCAAASTSTTTCFPTSGWPTRRRWTTC